MSRHLITPYGQTDHEDSIPLLPCISPTRWHSNKRSNPVTHCNTKNKGGDFPLLTSGGGGFLCVFAHFEMGITTHLKQSIVQGCLNKAQRTPHLIFKQMK